MNRADFQNLALIRLAEAKALLVSGNPNGAYYLAGYVVECALKACIARQTRAEDFPPRPELVREMYTHEPIKLLRQAGLDAALNAQRSSDPAFRDNWAQVVAWTVEKRYLTFTHPEAQSLLDAIENPTEGVLPWLQQYW